MVPTFQYLDMGNLLFLQHPVATAPIGWGQQFIAGPVNTYQRSTERDGAEDDNAVYYDINQIRGNEWTYRNDPNDEFIELSPMDGIDRDNSDIENIVLFEEEQMVTIGRDNAENYNDVLFEHDQMGTIESYLLSENDIEMDNALDFEFEQIGQVDRDSADDHNPVFFEEDEINVDTVKLEMELMRPPTAPAPHAKSASRNAHEKPAITPAAFIEESAALPLLPPLVQATKTTTPTPVSEPTFIYMQETVASPKKTVPISQSPIPCGHQPACLLSINGTFHEPNVRLWHPTSTPSLRSGESLAATYRTVYGSVAEVDAAAAAAASAATAAGFLVDPRQRGYAAGSEATYPPWSAYLPAYALPPAPHY